jgi:hypothetical protein
MVRFGLLVRISIRSEKAMTNKSMWVWMTFVLLLNVLAVGWLRYEVVSGHSDKSIILFWFGYPFIILGNGVAWLILRKTRLNTLFPKIILALLLLFFPLLFTLYGL